MHGAGSPSALRGAMASECAEFGFDPLWRPRANECDTAMPLFPPDAPERSATRALRAPLPRDASYRTPANDTHVIQLRAVLPADL
jgi:hypothetical protein